MPDPHLSLVQPPPKPPAPKRCVPAKLLGGVESPATVPLVPQRVGKDTWDWWSHDGILLGGICVSQKPPANSTVHTKIMHALLPIPRSWAGRKFVAVAEYEAPRGAHFQLKVHYGCGGRGDPSELDVVASPLLDGETGSKRRVRFNLDHKLISCNQLFRCTLEVSRDENPEVYVYGVWLELGV